MGKNIAKSMYLWHILFLEFEWDHSKNKANLTKHGVSFDEAQYAFLDPDFKIRIDVRHSTVAEKRYFSYGRVGRFVLTVRFTVRNYKIRIFGAGYWREGRKYYDKKK